MLLKKDKSEDKYCPTCGKLLNKFVRKVDIGVFNVVYDCPNLCDIISIVVHDATDTFIYYEEEVLND
jgi:hypothetical protein